MFRSIFIIFFFLTNAAFANKPVHYWLEYYSENNYVTVTIRLPDDAQSHADTLIIPRSAPGTYALTDYSAFVEEVSGTTTNGEVLPGKKGMGSYYTFARGETFLAAISYRVDIKRMEATLKSGSDSSKLRHQYLGILGYSVFGFVDGTADREVNLYVRTSPEWPIFSTLSPRSGPKNERAEFSAASFSELADAQYLLGKGFKISEVDAAPIPLFVAVYSETAADLNEIGRRALISLNGLAGYFGDVPMPHYTMVLEYLVPPTPEHNYGFWMEHLNSMTGSNEAAKAIKRYEENPEIGGIVHHMAHSWIPLRSYGEGYRPFNWQVAPIIETIWLNEGFAWYITYHNVLERENSLDFFKQTIESAPDYIKALSLRGLSRLGSTQYSEDFRIGMNLFSRGALLAHDLDEETQLKTNGTKSFRDIMLGLLQWTKVHKRAFTYDEIEPIMSAAVGVDLSSIWKHWQGPQQ